MLPRSGFEGSAPDAAKLSTRFITIRCCRPVRRGGEDCRGGIPKR
jgi:hypothetical protein